MLKRVKWILVFKIFAWIVCLSGTVVLMSFINVKKQEVKCAKVDILIPGVDNFIEIDEINAILRQSQGDLIGRNLEKINLQEIEKSIADNPYIDFVKVYAEMNGTVSVEIKQREPVLRVITANGQDYYIDKEGLKIPISTNFTADVLVATGNIVETFNGKVDTLFTDMAKNLFDAAKYIRQDDFWDSQIEQILVNPKNEIELIPRLGNQRIILGSANDIDIKLNNLMVFYKQVMSQVGWETYKTINLKYTNQVICQKRDSLEIKNKPKNLFLDTLLSQKNSIDSAINIEKNNSSQPIKATESSKTKEEEQKITATKKEVVVEKAKVKTEENSIKENKVNNTEKPKTISVDNKPKESKSQRIQEPKNKKN